MDSIEMDSLQMDSLKMDSLEMHALVDASAEYQVILKDAEGKLEITVRDNGLLMDARLNRKASLDGLTLDGRTLGGHPS